MILGLPAGPYFASSRQLALVAPGLTAPMSRTRFAVGDLARDEAVSAGVVLMIYQAASAAGEA